MNTQSHGAPGAAGSITAHEAEAVQRANARGLQPVVFVHGLWLLPSSWDRWATVFEEAGYVALTPGWPDDPDTVAEANAHPEVMAGKTIGQVADHFADIVTGLTRKPAIVGHSFGGLLARAVPRCAAPADLVAEIRLPSARQPFQPQARGAADL